MDGSARKRRRTLVCNAASERAAQVRKPRRQCIDMIAEVCVYDPDIHVATTAADYKQQIEVLKEIFPRIWPSAAI